MDRHCEPCAAATSSANGLAQLGFARHRSQSNTPLAASAPHPAFTHSAEPQFGQPRLTYTPNELSYNSAAGNIVEGSGSDRQQQQAEYTAPYQQPYYNDQGFLPASMESYPPQTYSPGFGDSSMTTRSTMTSDWQPSYGVSGSEKALKAVWALTAGGYWPMEPIRPSKMSRATPSQRRTEDGRRLKR